MGRNCGCFFDSVSKYRWLGTYFFLMNFCETKINSDEAFEKLVRKLLILRKMIQYKIPNALRLTIGNEQANEHFIQSVGSVFK